MNFFEAQDAARSRSRTLVLLFLLAVVCIILAVYAVVHVVFGPGPGAPVDPGLLLVVAFLTGLVVAAGSTFRTFQLRQGGGRVAELLGGRRVRMDTTDELERRLVNVVEEMAIASGTPVPAIYVLDQEHGINAFAAGYTLDDAAVAVTRGALRQLTRDELQGVIAHEFSHILNGDMRLNIRMMGLLFGILLLAVAGRIFLDLGRGGGRRRNDGAGQIALLGLALVVVGYVGVFFGRLIQAAVSRQREYLADAAAVQFTRNAEGLAGALKKVGAFGGARIRNPHAQEAAHLFFASGLRGSFLSLLSTHPPLDDRIRRLDPSFDGRYPLVPPDVESFLASAPPLQHAARKEAAVAAGLAASTRPRQAASQASGDPAGGVRPATASQAVSGSQASSAVTGDALVASIGAPGPDQVAYAAELLRTLPEEVKTAAHEPDGAAALLLALLLHDDVQAAGARQRAAIEEHGGVVLLDRVGQLAPQVRSLGARVRLPLVDILLPALRELSPDQAARVRATAEAMIAADGRTDVFELATLHVLRRQLAAGEPGRSAGDRVGTAIQSFKPIAAEVETVLSGIAWSGAPDESAAVRAFDAGRQKLPEQLGFVGLRAREAVTVEAVDAALERLRVAAPAIRRRFLHACAHAVAHDGRVYAQEAELLRAVAEAVDCPMPPVVSRQS